MNKSNFLRLCGYRAFVLAAMLACAHPANAELFAVSQGESVNYYAFGGQELGSTNFGITIYGLATDQNDNIVISALNEGPIKLSGTTGSGSSLAVGSSAPFYYGVAFDSAGNLYMTTDADTGSSSDINVFKYNGDSGTPALLASSGSNGSYSVKNTIAVDPVSGNIFVADYYNNIIYEYGPAGGNVPIATLTTGISQPFDLAIDSNHNLYVTDAGNNSLIKFTDETGTPTTIASNLGDAGGVAIDDSNDVFVIGFNTTSGHDYISEYGSNGALLSGTFVDLGYDSQSEYLTIDPIPEADPRLLAISGAGGLLLLGRSRRSRLPAC
jgi:hypothetical protein